MNIFDNIFIDNDDIIKNKIKQFLQTIIKIDDSNKNLDEISSLILIFIKNILTSENQDNNILLLNILLNTNNLNEIFNINSEELKKLIAIHNIEIVYLNSLDSLYYNSEIHESMHDFIISHPHRYIYSLKDFIYDFNNRNHISEVALLTFRVKEV